MTDSDASERFAGTAAYYAEYRPRYGDRTIQHLVDRFDLDETARVLDLGCGAGQIAIPLAPHVSEVVGMDPNEAMLREASKRAGGAGVENVSWTVGSDSDVDDSLGSFRLTAMGRSFHWMDQEPLLDRLFQLTEPGGGVALVGDNEWLTRGHRAWQDEVYDVAGDYVDDLPERTGPVEEYPGPSWDGLIAEAGFADVTTWTTEFEREWTIGEVVGYVLSLSFCSPETLGSEQAAFESDVRARLQGTDRETFVQDVEVQVISGRRFDDG